MKPDKIGLFISEIFLSIQGEGTYKGRREIFIRTAGCNLRCRNCDTKYALSKGRFMSIEYIIKHIKQFNSKFVCVTGGEPLIQNNTHYLIDTLIRNHYSISLETNGTLDISQYKNIHFMFDIKTPSSGYKNNFNPDSIKYLQKDTDVFFLIHNKKDFLYSCNIVKKYALDKKTNVFFTPDYNTIKYKTLTKWILKIEYDISLNVQLHKIVFGDKRGV